MRYSTKPKYRKYVEGYGFFFLLENLEILIDAATKTGNRCYKNCF